MADRTGSGPDNWKPPTRGTGHRSDKRRGSGLFTGKYGFKHECGQHTDRAHGDNQDCKGTER